MKIIARRFDTGKPCELTLADGRIEAIRTVDVELDGGLWIAPGFVDIQVNGYGGQEFSSATLTVDAVERIAAD